MPWRLTVRTGPRVRRERHEDFDAALAAAAAHAREQAQSAPGTAVDVRFRRFEAVERVIARVEVAGPERLLPSVRAGLDVRADGSTEAYLGRVRRELVKQRRGETPYRALRRAAGAKLSR